MIGRLNTKVKEAVVIGAGYAGLISAYRLLKNGYSVTVYEKSSRSGGLISTIPAQQGLVETAAHSIRSSQEMLNLFKDIDVPYVPAQTSKKFICRNGRLRKNPLTLWEMFAAGSYAAFKRSTGDHRTLAQWANDHIGPGALDNAIAPLAHGIYAAEPEELDQELAFPRLTIPKDLTLVDKMFKKRNTDEKSFVMSPRFGMQDLTDALTKYIVNHDRGDILYGQDITSLPASANTIVATPAHTAGELTGSKRLTQHPYAPMVTATVFVRKSSLQKLKGIGFLNARGDDQKILGVLFNSSCFDARTSSPDIESLTVMMGGTRQPQIAGEDEDKIHERILSELKKILGLKAEPLSIHITRWENAIPLYSQDLRSALYEAEKGWCADPGHILFGNYTGEVSLRGMCNSSLALANQ